jgi:hypothetical protein
VSTNYFNLSAILRILKWLVLKNFRFWSFESLFVQALIQLIHINNY